jgi:hypothetical protein
MAGRKQDEQPPMDAKQALSGLLGGCGFLLLIAAIIAGAVLWQAAWYVE